MKKLLLSAIAAVTLVSSANAGSAWDFCSDESQIGVAAGSMGAGVLIANATAGGVPGLIVGAILNQLLCTTDTEVKENSDEPKLEVQTALETKDAGLTSIFFDFDQYILDEDAKADVKDNAGMLLNYSKPIRIEGNADSRGSDEYNYALALKRATEVKNRLISEGVKNQIDVVSYGESKPICSDYNEDCFGKNRRVDFKIVE